MFDHAVFDVAALGGVVVDQVVDTVSHILWSVHRTSNLPIRGRN